MDSTADSPQPGVNLGGRPSSFSPAKLRAICAFIEYDGLSELAAGEMAGVTRSTLSRWKHGSEEIATEMEAARVRYLIPRLQRIAETRLRDGTLDWRAQAWLVKFADPEGHGSPSRRRRLRDIEVPEEVARPAAEQAAFADLDLGLAGWREYQPGATMTPPMRRVLEIYRQAGEEIPTAPPWAKSVTFPPETPGAKERMKSVANPPETLPTAEQPASEPMKSVLLSADFLFFRADFKPPSVPDSRCWRSGPLGGR